ncbi:hypothetical protein [Pseudomonas gingeri]|uniref:Uncharacterized protein n=1 Tax=Pseudomonas gingeri TaxID=117681 RepID=A0A7Y7WDR1_9PSED|nr:hypothetical protein [Pseudomonas gingeri]NWB47525.1 hypothetical protein [Pseudomonas gingeri]
MNVLVKTARAHRTGTKSNPMDIGALIITDAIPGYSGLVPVVSLSAPLELTMNNWFGGEQQTVIQLMWDGIVNNRDEINEPGARRTIQLAEEDDLSVVFEFTISETFLATQSDGPHIVYARARSLSDGDDFTSTPIILDRTAPGGGSLPAPKFSETIEASSELTELDLVDIGGGVLVVPAGLVHYEDIFRGDLIEPMIDGIVYPAGAYTFPDVNAPEVLPIYYPEAAVRALTPGPHEFYVRVTDKAGNVAVATLAESKRVLNVQIGLAPGPLFAPLVPAYDDGLITEADARVPLQVWIPRYNNPSAGDGIEVHWGGQVANIVPLIGTDLPNDPILKIDLDYELVMREGSGSFDVFYRVYRRGGEIPASPSPRTPVIADLSTPGGEDPDHETPIHENLDPLRVQGGATAPPSPVNELVDADLLLQDVTLTIPLRSTDQQYKLEAGDELRVTWGTQPEYTLTPNVTGPEAGGAADLTRLFPTSYIRNNGSGDDIPVYYTVTRALSVPPHTATSQSPDQSVKVETNADLPGGGTLPNPIFPDLLNGLIVGPNELKLYPSEGPGRFNPVRARLPAGLANVAVNDTIQIFFRGFRNVEGSQGTPPIPIPAADFTSQIHPINTEDLRLEYFDVLIPEQYHYAVCRLGSVEAQVKITNGKGTTSSDWALVLSQVKCPGWADCSEWDTVGNPPCRA